MNTSKETKTAGKAQKKTQKANKKQKQQQLQQRIEQIQQPQQQLNNGIKNSNMKIGATNQTTPTSGFGANKSTWKSEKIPTNVQQVQQEQQQQHMHNNNNNSIQNNNNNNSNISQKLKGYYDADKQKVITTTAGTILPGYENVPKMERSNSFSLKGKLSKLLNSITGSKENLTRTESDDDINNKPYTFTRSRSMIMLRRSNRRSFIEPQLEQLSEEAEKSSDPTSPSPRKNSLAEIAEPITTATTTATTTIARDESPLLRKRSDSMISQQKRDFLTPRRQSAQPFTSTPFDETTELERKPSLVSLTPSETKSSTFNPQLNFQKRRSNTLIASFKSTFSGLSSEKKKEKMNPAWSASLQSLQAIDNMVSYKNMSFIDYDKFNGYEKQLERQLSTISLMESQQPALPQQVLPQQSLPQQSLPQHTETITQTSMDEKFADISAISDNNSVQSINTPPNPSSLQTTPQTVVRRRKHSSSSSGPRKASSRTSLRSSYNFDTDFEHNLDKPRNVYRDSLDSRKLERLNDFSRNSFILDKDVVDVLNLEDGSVGRRRAACVHRMHSSASFGLDTVDASNVVQLKSKSLTHLDGLDSMIACHHGNTAPGKPNVVSSSEYFSVSFCLETGCQEEEFIPATKGVILLTALSQALRKRNLNFSQITITDNNSTPSCLEAGSSPLASSLDENTEVENLAGHHLIITERDNSRKTLQKAASFGSRTRPPRLLSSASTEETSDSTNATGKQIKQRWSGLFGIKNPQQSQLCELLNSYGRNGVPQKTTSLNFDHPDFDAAQHYLDNMHKSWFDIVESSGMSESEMKIQTAIWELVTTEVYYIHALQTVTDLFLACLEAVQEERLLIDVDQHRLFSNVRDICEANLKFWTFHLYPMVAHSIATREPMRCAFFQQGFLEFASIFAPYKKYCAEQSTCQFYCKELNRSNTLFTSYLAWCESQKMCNRLRLADIIVRPMQRLTKYSLLLAAIKKHMSRVDDIEAVDTMIHIVENFVCSVNNHLTTRQENERLKGVMARIESYDVVDTNNEQLDKLIKMNSQMFDLCAPMKGCPEHQVRHLFMEGDHKYKDNLGKADVHCFLLTDMLLVCKTIAKKGLGALKVIRQPYLTDRLEVHHTVNSNTLNCVYLNEFHVAVTAFTLQCTEAKNWNDALRRAKTIYTALKKGTGWGDSFRFIGSGASGGTADSLGVKKSPMNSSICSHVTSANNSHSGSAEWNDSRNISVDYEKTNSLSSDEGSSLLIGGVGHGHGHGGGLALKVKPPINNTLKLKMAITSSANTLSVQPLNSLGQSLPNLNLHHSHT